MRRRAWAVALVMAVGLAGAVEATQTLFTDFEGFKTGASINGQNGWARTGPYDEQVVNAGGNTVWRVSNATASGSFGDMPFAPRLGGIPANTVSNPTNGSPGAFAGESSTGTSLTVFQATFSFRSATGAPQPGARITVSADNGSGGRQSFISLTDTGAGINVYTYDVNSDGTFTPDTATSPGILIASGLSYTKWHTTSVEIRFKDGPNNDVVRYFVNGKRVHTGPSWEQFYRNFQAGLHPMGVPVQTLLFRLSAPPFNPPCLACVGGGFYIDKLSLSVSRSGEKGGDDEDDNDHEEHNSYSVALGAGEENQYALAAGPDTISLTAVLADGQGLVMDILNPLGTVVASSLPSVGGATLVVPTVLPGDYTMRVRNIGLTDVTTKLTLIRSITP